MGTSSRVSACVDDETLAAFVSGELGAEELSRVEQHLGACDSCLQAAAAAVSGSELEPASPSPVELELPDSYELLRARFGVGQIIAGRFEVVRFIARGGMGEVYEVEDQVLRSRTALKALAVDGNPAAESLVRFRREVALARRVTHPNVCRVYDVGVHEDPKNGAITFLTMELLSGRTLSEHLRRKGPLTPEAALPIVQDICAGLGAAHAAGIIHRDFKSSNVMLHGAISGPRRAVVTDFGLARLHEGDATLTRRGQILGTPATMAPEQVLGERITVATDIYALGCVLFEMLSGTLPFASTTPFASANLRLTQPAPALRTRAPNAPPYWERAVARCLEREPGRRFGSTAEVLESLLAPRARASPLLGRPRGGGLVSLTVVGLAVVVLGAGSFATRARIWATLRSATTSVGLAGGAGESQLAGREHGSSVIPVEDVHALRPQERTVAIVPPESTATSDGDWLGTALAEMLGAELAASSRFQLVPGEAVARAEREVSRTRRGPLSEVELGRLAALTGAQLLLHGSIGPEPDHGTEHQQLRFDLELYDVAETRPALRVSAVGPSERLPDLAARLGAELRQRLGLPPLDATAAQGVRSVTAETPAAVRAYAEGLAFERAFEWKLASERFLAVVELAPDYPLGHAELAHVYRLMGKDSLARKEAARALAAGGSLPREQQLLLEARAHAACQEWSRAAEAYDTLFRFDPENAQYGIQLARMLLNDGRPDAAFGALAELRKLPAPVSSSPEIDLVEALAAAKASDFARGRRVARSALVKGEATGSKSLIAEAKSALSEAEYHLGDRSAALQHRSEAKELFSELGDQRGLASALDALGDLYLAAGDYAAALKSQEQALNIAREIGHQYRVGGLLNSMGQVQQSLGDFAAARRLYEQARDTYQAMNEREGTGHTTANIASLLFEQGDLEQARPLFETALALHVAVGARIGEAHERIELGRIAHAAGKLDEARERCQQGRAIVEALGDRETIAEAQLALSDIERDAGHPEPARSGATAALEIAQQLGDVESQVDAELQLVRLAIDEGDAAGAADRAASIAARAGARPAQRALASALRARARSRLQRSEATAPEADLAARQAAAQLPSFWQRTEIALAFAERDARSGAALAATEQARQALVEAQKRGAVGVAFEARLVLARSGGGDPQNWQDLLSEARAKGYGRILAEARTLPRRASQGVGPRERR